MKRINKTTNWTKKVLLHLILALGALLVGAVNAGGRMVPLEEHSVPDFVDTSKVELNENSIVKDNAGTGRDRKLAPKDTKAPKSTKSPTISPSGSPTRIPSSSPSAFPSVSPTISPSSDPSSSPSAKPSVEPTPSPSTSPSISSMPSQPKSVKASTTKVPKRRIK